MNPINPADRQITTNLEEHNIMINKINEIVGAISGVETNVATMQVAVTTMDGKVTLFEGTITDIITKVADHVKNLEITADESTVTLTITKEDGTIINIPFPVASSTVAGVMNRAQATALEGYEGRISALENVGTTYILTLPNSDPTENEINTAYTTTYPSAPYPPLNGCFVYDPSKPLKYTYNVNTTSWVKTADAGVSKWTNTTFGVVKGSASGNGTIYAESDGTGSVIGWDALNNKVTSLENGIDNLDTVNSPTKIEIKGFKSDGTEKVTKEIRNVTNPAITDDNENCVITKKQYAILMDKLINQGEVDYCVPSDATIISSFNDIEIKSKYFSIVSNNTVKTFLYVRLPNLKSSYLHAGQYNKGISLNRTLKAHGIYNTFPSNISFENFGAINVCATGSPPTIVESTLDTMNIGKFVNFYSEGYYVSGSYYYTLMTSKFGLTGYQKVNIGQYVPPDSNYKIVTMQSLSNLYMEEIAVIIRIT